MCRTEAPLVLHSVMLTTRTDWCRLPVWTMCKCAGPPQGTKSLEVQELASHAACYSGAACVQGTPWSEEVPRHPVERETEAHDGYKAWHKNSRLFVLK